MNSPYPTSSSRPASTAGVKPVPNLAGTDASAVTDWLEDVELEIDRLHTVAKGQHADPALTRGLYALRATVQAAVALLLPAAGDELSQAVDAEIAALHELLDEYQFSRPAGGITVHIVHPEPATTRERNLCSAPVGLVAATRPDGPLCTQCATAFIRRVFPASTTPSTTSPR